MYAVCVLFMIPMIIRQYVKNKQVQKIVTTSQAHGDDFFERAEYYRGLLEIKGVLPEKLRKTGMFDLDEEMSKATSSWNIRLAEILFRDEGTDKPQSRNFRVYGFCTCRAQIILWTIQILMPENSATIEYTSIGQCESDFRGDGQMSN